MELYDPGCRALAEDFLEADETNTPERCDEHEKRVVSLAQRIQEAVEDWIEEEPT